jgi:hypothetical protein
VSPSSSDETQMANNDSVMLFGMIYQGVGLGVCAPLYLLAHLASSPTATKPTADNVAVPDAVMLAILPALAIGFVAPTIVMSLPMPGLLSLDAKTLAVVLWQPFPIWTCVLCILFSHASIQSSLGLTSIATRKATYNIIIAVAAVAHILGLTLSVAPLVAPNIFNQAHSKDLVDAYLSFPPWPIGSSVKASGIREGTFWFLQYDYIITSWAYLIWSVSLRLASVSKGAQASGSQIVAQWFSALIKAAVLGPIGGAATLVWERDENILAGSEQRDASKKSQ